MSGTSGFVLDGEQYVKLFTLGAACTAVSDGNREFDYSVSRRAPINTCPGARFGRLASTAAETDTVALTGATSPTELDVAEVVPADLSDREAREAVMAFVERHPGADACDIADALDLPMRRAFAIADALIDEGKIEVAEG